ncbi:MAG: hypothetical protein MUP67_05520 [Acidimicrobiia bacterium]|nr:hypothetical protein [Acidimicrobiia bacterium]
MSDVPPAGTTRPVLGCITPDASPDEVAAIVAAIGECTWAVASPPGGEVSDDTLHEWVNTARVISRRAGLQRGPWRLSGRSGRRSRV